MKELSYASIFFGLILFLGVLLMINTLNDYDHVEKETTKLVSDKYMIVEYKWDSFNTSNCRYDMLIKGFKPLHRETDRNRRVTLIESCNMYEKGDTLYIVNKLN